MQKVDKYMKSCGTNTKQVLTLRQTVDIIIIIMDSQQVAMNAGNGERETRKLAARNKNACVPNYKEEYTKCR